MLLKHNDLTIRNATVDDASQLEKWWNDGKVMAHAGFPLGLETTAQDIAAQIARDTDENRRLILELDGRPIGEMNYRAIEGGAAETGIKICDFSLHEKGLGKQYLSMLIRSLFEDFGYSKVVLDTNLKNERAQHVYERLGFKKVRVRENSWIDQLEEPQSTVDYELTPENFIDFAK